MRIPLTAGVLVAAFLAVASISTPSMARGRGGFGHFHHGRGGHYSRMAFHRGGRSGFFPPGWGHGRKIGWGGFHMPPGLRRMR